jgi:adenosylcobinamide amidohydrolase
MLHTQHAEAFALLYPKHVEPAGTGTGTGTVVVAKTRNSYLQQSALESLT